MSSEPSRPADAQSEGGVSGARRPIRARQSRWAPRLSRALIHLGLTPNQVSALSVLFALAAGCALAASAEMTGTWRVVMLLLAATSIQLRLLCNLLDGLMAVEGGMRSPLGDLYNDVPDRLSDSLTLVGAGCAARHLAYGLTLGWGAALLAVMIAYLRVLGAANGLPHDYSGPMAKQQRMAIVTLASLAAIFEPLWTAHGQVMRAALALIVAGCIVTIIRRLARMAAALRRRTTTNSTS